jgi:hypothetical protein
MKIWSYSGCSQSGNLAGFKIDMFSIGKALGMATLQTARWLGERRVACYQSIDLIGTVSTTHIGIEP